MTAGRLNACQFNVLAAGSVAVAFGVVVVLTRFATLSLDQRLIQDATEDDRVQTSW
ncbi:hypothetical protein [Pararobbsia alpina]|uniref:Uncharacterized protein n=1 Tax=Pararobbsia alpina TaxID=621374 RepID=A0A6S7BTZ4_9BURK|nr:hypothetical protein [Pararobbsia alpina]CAB3799233.1 hypothetical protein LMG28138_04617 [Pararobbsia alpina]